MPPNLDEVRRRLAEGRAKLEESKSDPELEHWKDRYDEAERRKRDLMHGSRRLVVLAG